MVLAFINDRDDNAHPPCVVRRQEGVEERWQEFFGVDLVRDVDTHTHLVFVVAEQPRPAVR